ncbi:hypothetical protein GT022_17870 [Agaribacter marinus]|uniref:Uncharacterized protein n=1 Tax=Virgibacillus salarius TaxID=447199 RepID=A0A941DY98_9BACI|nr:hypothetical protein [Virgibacillus salarius]MBR7797901.1 hypothetical protein [Virgibacillus salarius]NAZ10611.1 hypothetical protein [Agaribacter marinus]
MKWVVEISKDRFELLKELEEKQEDEIKIAADKLNKLWAEINFIDQIIDSYKDYQLFKEENNISTRNIVRSINNYLTAY